MGVPRFQTGMVSCWNVVKNQSGPIFRALMLYVLQLLGTLCPRPFAGALLLDPTGGLLFPRSQNDPSASKTRLRRPTPLLFSHTQCLVSFTRLIIYWRYASFSVACFQTFLFVMINVLQFCCQWFFLVVDFYSRRWQSRGGERFTCVCLCVFFPHNISKTAAARITKLDVEMLQGESQKPIYFGSQKVKVSHKNSSGVGLCTLLNAGFF